MFHRAVLSAVLLWVLAACAALPVGSPALQGDWHEVGVSASGNVEHAIDARSVRLQGDDVVFRERVRVLRMEAQTFTQTPAYKVAINQWQMNCRQKNYRLMATQLFDVSGNLIADHRYATGNAQSVRIGSASERQFERMCAPSS